MNFVGKYFHAETDTYIVDFNDKRHSWKDSKCKLKQNKNAIGTKLYSFPVGTCGTLTTYKNPYNNKTSWSIVFNVDECKYTFNDLDTFERYIEKVK